MAEADLYILTGTLAPNGTPTWAPWSTSNPAPVDIGSGTVTLPSTITLEGTADVVISPSSAAGDGIVAVTTQTTLETSHLAKASAGNLYSAYVTNTSTVDGYLFVMNASSVVADGTLGAGVIVDAVHCGTKDTKGVDYSPGPPEHFMTGIALCFSSTAPPVKTEAGTCFFNARVK